jgi:hypothetical protein
LIYVIIRGYPTNMMEVADRIAQGEHVPDDDYYFGIPPAHETSDERGWLQRAIVVAQEEMIHGGVRYEAYAVR